MWSHQVCDFIPSKTGFVVCVRVSVHLCPCAVPPALETQKSRRDLQEVNWQQGGEKM